MTASATSVKSINVLRQCYNFLNVIHSSHCKKCITCVFLVVKKSTESWINVKKKLLHICSTFWKWISHLFKLRIWKQRGILGQFKID